MKRKHKNLICIFTILLAIILIFYKTSKLREKKWVASHEWIRDKSSNDQNFKCKYQEVDVHSPLAWKSLNLSQQAFNKKFNSCEDSRRKIELINVIYEFDGSILLNLKKDLIKLQFHTNSPDCYVQKFDKIMNQTERIMGLTNDEKFYFTKQNDFQIKLKKHGFYHAKCLLKKNRKIYVIFENVYSILPSDMSLLQRQNINVKSSKPRFNVFAFGIDSLSRAHFQRVLPKTHQYLTQLSHNHILNQFNSVGINTFPNLIPFLSGIVEEEIPALNLSSEINSYIEPNTSFFDRIPFIWNEYEREGYLTSLNQDLPKIGFLNYLKDGFRFQPTSYYTRSYWIKYYKIRRGPMYCHNGMPTYRNYLNLIRSFIDQMSTTKNKHIPFFSFNFLTECTHDHYAVPPKLDDALIEFLEYLKVNGLFNNTLFIVFSDHGARLTRLSYETDVGKIEKYQPFLSIRLPNALHNTQIEKNLETNHNRLIGFFDLYQTLRHFLYMKRDSSDFKQNSITNRHARGISLFEKIPQNRSCLDALIAEKICLCYESKELNEELYFIETRHKFNETINMIVNKINSITNNYRKLCAEFQFFRLSSIKKIIFSDASVLYRFVIILQPGDAWFEINLKRNLVINGAILRLSPYARQSECVNTDVYLKNFCFCK